MRKFYDISKKLLRLITIVLSCFLIYFICSSLFFWIGGKLGVFFAHKEIKENYQKTEYAYVYTDRTNSEDVVRIHNLINVLSGEVKEEIEQNWIILISETEPTGKYSDEDVLGITLDTKKVIWLSYDFSEETFYHEIGHAVASIQSKDMSIEFLSLYEAFKAKNLDFRNQYAISNSKEFFASLYAHYYGRPELLKEISEEGYDYISDFISNFNNKPTTKISTPFIKFWNIFSGTVRTYTKTISVK